MPLQKASAKRKEANAPHFSGQSSGNGMLGLLREFAPPPNAVQQFAQDTLGVWVPKAPVALYRSKLQFFEDTFLEFVEDGAFYFTIPIAGKILGKLINRKNAFTKDYRDIGASWSELAGKLKHQPALEKSLVAAKSGAALGALGSALAFEFMIQHMKNVITAKEFKTTNFTGVAGLEHSRTELREGEIDPVAKAKKRGKQVGLLTAGTLVGALALPHLLKRNDTLLSGARKALAYLNFASAKERGAFFDTQKAFQALLTFVGLAGYLDAARDKLEWKEQLTRLAVVIPYLLFGKQLVAQGLAHGVQKFAQVGSGASRKALGEYVSIIKGSALKQARRPETFLDLGVTKDVDAIKAELAKRTDIPADVAKSITKWARYGVDWGSYVISAAIAGVGINLVSYAMTRKRHEIQEQQRHRNQPSRQSNAEPRQHPFPSFPLSGQPTPALTGGWPTAPSPVQSFAAVYPPGEAKSAPFGTYTRSGI